MILITVDLTSHIICRVVIKLVNDLVHMRNWLDLFVFTHNADILHIQISEPLYPNYVK